MPTKAYPSYIASGSIISGDIGTTGINRLIDSYSPNSRNWIQGHTGAQGPRAAGIYTPPKRTLVDSSDTVISSKRNEAMDQRYTSNSQESLEVLWGSVPDVHSTFK